MAELVDAPDLGSGAARRGGSSPFTRTNIFIKIYYFHICRDLLEISIHPSDHPVERVESVLVL